MSLSVTATAPSGTIWSLQRNERNSCLNREHRRLHNRVALAVLEDHPNVEQILVRIEVLRVVRLKVDPRFAFAGQGQFCLRRNQTRLLEQRLRIRNGDLDREVDPRSG